jgi:hypothetical protein
LQQINYVSKAKQLMKSAVRTTALVIMPLATAVNMQAGALLPTGPVVCDAEGAGGHGGCSGGAAQLPEYNNLDGVKLYTNGPVYFTNSGGGISTLQLSIASGSMTGGLLSGVEIPVSYVFELGLATPSADSLPGAFAGSGETIGAWTLDYRFLLSDETHAQIGAASTSGSGAGIFSGTLNMTTQIPVSHRTDVDLQVQLTVNWTGGGSNQDLFIDVPPNSFDFNAVPDESGVPEPGSMGLLASGLALLGWRVCRRRRA